MPLEVACKSSKGLALSKTCADRRQVPNRPGGRLFARNSFIRLLLQPPAGLGRPTSGKLALPAGLRPSEGPSAD